MGNIKEKVTLLLAVLMMAFVLHIFALHPAYAEEILLQKKHDSLAQKTLDFSRILCYYNINKRE